MLTLLLCSMAGNEARWTASCVVETRVRYQHCVLRYLVDSRTQDETCDAAVSVSVGKVQVVRVEEESCDR